MQKLSGGQLIDECALMWAEFRKKALGPEPEIPEIPDLGILSFSNEATECQPQSVNFDAGEKCDKDDERSDDKKVGTINSVLTKKMKTAILMCENSRAEELKSIFMQNANCVSTVNRCPSPKCGSSSATTFAADSIPLSDATPVRLNNSYNSAQQRQAKKESPAQIKRDWLAANLAIGCGFNNTSNNCYLNSVTQAVFHIPAIANRFNEHLKFNCCHANSTDPCLMCIVSRTWKNSTMSKSSTSLYHLFKAVQRFATSFAMSFTEQEDAHEFYLNLLQSLENSRNARLKTVSNARLRQQLENAIPINDLFAGQLSIEIKCKKCNYANRRTERFENILLEIPNNKAAISINEAFSNFFGKEHMDDCDYKCDSCKRKVPITKQFFVREAPKVLCVQVKRFSMTGNKINKCINYDCETSLDSFVCPSVAASAEKTPLRYKLISIVSHHSKTANHGHYTCTSQVNKDQFYDFNDHCVTKYERKAFLSLGKLAYLFFYELDEVTIPQTKPNDDNKENELPKLAYSKPTSSDLTANANVEASNRSKGLSSENATKRDKKSHRKNVPANNAFVVPPVNSNDGNKNKRRSSKKAK